MAALDAADQTRIDNLIIAHDAAKAAMLTIIAESSAGVDQSAATVDVLVLTDSLSTFGTNLNISGNDILSVGDIGSAAIRTGVIFAGQPINFFGLRSNTEGTPTWGTISVAAGTWDFRIATSGSSLNYDWENVKRATLAISGDWTNANNAYGGFSDRALKQDIEDIRSQWNDVKAFRFRNFKYIEEVKRLGVAAKIHLGVIHDEINQISPGVTSMGEDGIGSVNYMLVNLKAVGALQEAMQRIEVMEARLSAIEAG